jgi:glutamyl-tRNA reductase
MESKMSSSSSPAATEIEATVCSLKRRLEAVRQHEVNRMRARLGRLNSTQQDAVESLTHGIVDQILHTPIKVLKGVSPDDDSTTTIETIRRVFHLGELRTAVSSDTDRTPNVPVGCFVSAQRDLDKVFDERPATE